jgi:hypothetical protein
MLIAEARGSSVIQRKRNVHLPSRCQVKAGDDWEDFMCAVFTVVFGVWNSVRLSQLFVVTSVNVQYIWLPIQTPSIGTRNHVKIIYSKSSSWFILYTKLIFGIQIVVFCLMTKSNYVCEQQYLQIGIHRWYKYGILNGPGSSQIVDTDIKTKTCSSQLKTTAWPKP